MHNTINVNKIYNYLVFPISYIYTYTGLSIVVKTHKIVPHILLIFLNKITNFLKLKKKYISIYFFVGYSNTRLKVEIFVFTVVISGVFLIGFYRFLPFSYKSLLKNVFQFVIDPRQFHAIYFIRFEWPTQYENFDVM